jgi:hypothetical protein
MVNRCLALFARNSIDFTRIEFLRRYHHAMSYFLNGIRYGGNVRLAMPVMTLPIGIRVPISPGSPP